MEKKPSSLPTGQVEAKPLPPEDTQSEQPHRKCFAPTRVVRLRWFLVAAIILAVALLVLAPPTLTAKDGPGRTDKAGDHHGRDKHADLRLPASWAGQWEITTTYENAATHNIGAVDQTTDVICAHEPVGLAVFEDQVKCTGEVSGHRLSVRCTSQFSKGLCRIKGALQLAGERTGDTLLGSGQWSATVIGMCGPVESGGELIEVSGVRLSRKQAACAQPRSSLLRKFATHPALLMLMARAEDDDDDDDDD